MWYKDSPIATFDATNLDLKTNGPEIVDKAYIIGRTEHVPSRIYQKIATILGISNFRFDTKVTYSKGALEDFINNVQDQYEIPAKNALFTFENGRVVNFRKEEKGNKLNIGVDIALFNNKLQVTADYFNDKYYDLLQARGKSIELIGQNYPDENIAKDLGIVTGKQIGRAHV